MIWLSRVFAAALLLMALACPAQEVVPSDSELQAQLENIERDLDQLEAAE